MNCGVSAVEKTVESVHTPTHSCDSILGHQLPCGLDGEWVKYLQRFGKIYRRDQIIDFLIPVVVTEDDESLLYPGRERK